MSLPPERVSIKRKRDHEAVDILFLQDKKRPKFIFQKVTVDLGKNIFAPSAAPKTQTPSAPLEPTVASRPVGSSHKDAGPNAPKRPNLRQFRLDRPVGISRVQKLSRSASPRKQAVATFYETALSRQQQVEAKKVSVKAPVVATEKSLLAPVKRLRPRASAAELQWREKNWGSASGSRSASRAPAPAVDDPRELALAEQLSAFALAASSPASKKDVSKHDASLKSVLKFQPKPAPPRGRQRPGPGSDGDSSTASAGTFDINRDENHTSESESEYEYDTYVRIAVKEGDAMDVDASFADPALDGKTVGVLVIGDEDEELWEMYALDQEDESEFNTDEEDENAEDYYGNDYPEDELDSDDEDGRGAYGFRYADSDEEAFGKEDDEADWSDAEDRSSRRAETQLSGSWVNEFASPIQHQGLHPY